jgi:pyruvate dehydrogenase E1 component alpha subunit
MDENLLLGIYRDMLLIRRFEEVAHRCYTEGLISGFLHLYIGQEGVAVGAISGAESTDYIVATYREHGHYLARTRDVRGAMAELFGREAGCSKGRGGSMHLFDASQRFLGGHAIVGSHVPLAAGVAFASKYRGDADVTLCFFGDGSANMGAFHEGLCLASLWKLPVIFICENNLYAMGTPLYKTLAVEDVSTRALGYPMAREIINGDDVLEVRESVRRAVKRAREESLPTLIEAKTYRFRGHSVSDPAKYRTKEELDLWKKRDPIHKLGDRIINLGIANEAGLKEREADVRREVEEAVEFAKNAPPPALETLHDYVYAMPVNGPGRSR